MSENRSFSHLWNRARSGDRDAQAKLYIEYGPHLRRIIRLRLSDLKIDWAVESHDILNSFFVRLFADTQISIHDALHFTNYCERALRNKCVTALRSIARRTATSIDDCASEALWDRRATTADGKLDWDEQLACAYSRLTDREQLVCLLAAEGKSWCEIGQRLKVSANAARMVHQRAEARVRREVLAAVM
jgi:RNA polymerase sigma factor (sigma-70 family)